MKVRVNCSWLSRDPVFDDWQAAIRYVIHAMPDRTWQFERTRGHSGVGVWYRYSPTSYYRVCFIEVKQ